MSILTALSRLFFRMVLEFHSTLCTLFLSQKRRNNPTQVLQIQPPPPNNEKRGISGMKSSPFLFKKNPEFCSSRIFWGGVGFDIEDGHGGDQGE